MTSNRKQAGERTHDQTDQAVNISGNTYPVRDKLKALGARWSAAQKCWAISADKADQARAIVSGQPPLNNPIAVPPDLGPIDVAAECALHGRTPIGTSAVPFRRDSRKGEATTAGETFWGKDRGTRSRYLIIRDTPPYCLSSDTLEDNDDFQSDPGWYRSVEAVAVEPTDDEKAKDPVVLRAAKEAAEKAAKAKADAERLERLSANEPRLREIVAQVAASEELAGAGGCQILWPSDYRTNWDGPRLFGSAGFLIYRSKTTDVEKTYDDNSKTTLGRILCDPALSAEAFRLAEINVSYMD